MSIAGTVTEAMQPASSLSILGGTATVAQPLFTDVSPECETAVLAEMKCCILRFMTKVLSIDDKVHILIPFFLS